MTEKVVDPSKLDGDQKVLFAKKEYQKYNVGDPVYIGKGKNKTLTGYVSEVNHNKSTGEDSYVITDTQLPKHPSKAQLKSVENVTVLYRGSTTSMDWANNIHFGMNFAGLSNVTFGLLHSFNQPLQFKSSSQTLNKSMNKYSNAQFEVYGQSLGSMDGAYALSNLSKKQWKRLMGAYLYEGPNIFTTLNIFQMINVINNRDKIFNFIDPKDYVAFGYFNDFFAVGNVFRVDSKNVGWKDFAQHLWGGYQYKNGNTKLLPEDQMKLSMLLLGDLRKELKKGGLTKSEKIFLDQAEALVITNNIATIASDGIDKSIKECHTAIERLGDKWQESLKSADFLAPLLSDNEKMSSLENAGATHKNNVDNPTQHFTDKITSLKSLKQEYQDLVDDIKTTIKKTVEDDKELAGMFNGLRI